MTIEHLVRPNIRALEPYSSARAEFSGEAEVFLDANENPFPSPVNRYPDPSHQALKETIGDHLGVAHDQIIFGNGSDEIIDFIIRAFCVPGQDIVRYISPSFGMYKVAAKVNDIGTEEVPLTQHFEIDPRACLKVVSPRHKVLFLCSPNNPTGNSLNRERMIEVITAFPGIVVVDEAYIDFAAQADLVDIVDNHSNLIILRTFSKALGAAGLRIGYGIASSEIIGVLHRIKPPYNIGSIVQQEALAYFHRQGERSKAIGIIRAERPIVAERLKQIPQVIHVYPSDANFLLVRFLNAQGVKKYLQDQGVIVRDRSGLPGCEGCLRITIGTPEENKILIDRLKTMQI